MVDEQVAIVDRDNRVIGSAPRRRMRRERLLHRATYIFVFNRAGELLVQQRTSTKDLYPSYFDLAAGGVVLDGESYDISAARELEEELGLADVTLDRQFDFLHEDAETNCWGRVYTCESEGPFVLQVEEVAGAEFRSLAHIDAGLIAPITPDSITALARLRVTETRSGARETRG